jgi:TRAP-type C4-dicarboxylate transport system permease small subunit
VVLAVLVCRVDPEGRAAQGVKVSALKIVALLLIAAGIIGLVYGGITYTKTTHDAKVGPLELSIKDKETAHIPVWAGVGAIAVGGALLLLRKKQ